MEESNKYSAPWQQVENCEEDAETKKYSTETFEEECCLELRLDNNEDAMATQSIEQVGLATVEEDIQQAEIIQQADGEQTDDLPNTITANLLSEPEVLVVETEANQQHQQGEQADNLLPEQPQQQQPAASSGLSRDYLFALVNSISSTNLLSEESIDVLRELLCPPQPTFDSISLKDSHQSAKIFGEIIKEKATSANNALGNALNYYHKTLVDSQIHHLDKFTRIIKSKKREIHLFSVQSLAKKPCDADSLTETLEAMQNLSAPIETNNCTLTQSPLDIVGLLDNNQLGAMILKKKVVPHYNSSDRSITLRVNDKYEVKMRILNEKTYTHRSKIDCIPQHILQTHVFPYLTSSELFAMRTVSNEWRELIRGIWHVVFKREMLEQVVAADICNDIEMHFKLMQIRTPFYQKFGVFMKSYHGDGRLDRVR